MKIRVTTIREFSDDSFWDWADAILHALKRAGDNSFTRAHFDQLYNKGRFEITDPDGTGTVTTVYEVLDRENLQ